MNKKTLSYTHPSASKPRDSRAGFPSRVAPNHAINSTIKQVYQIQNYSRGIPLHVVESPAFAQLRSRSRCWYISRARTRYPLHGGNSNLKHVIISVSGTLPSFAQSLRCDMPPQWAIGLCWDGELDVALSFANALKYTDWLLTTKRKCHSLLSRETDLHKIRRNFWKSVLSKNWCMRGEFEATWTLGHSAWIGVWCIVQKNNNCSLILWYNSRAKVRNGEAPV